MRLLVDTTLEYHVPEPADVLLIIEAANMPDQQLIEERLTVTGMGPLRSIDGDDQTGRRTWTRAHGDFHAHYHAIVELERRPRTIEELPIVPRSTLPPDVIPYLWPSRYCEADQLEAFVEREFPDACHGRDIQKMADWIYEHVDYRSGSSDATTTAVDIFVKRQGVCRDFAHLLIGFVRAAGVPARMTSAYAWQLDPPDFHAVVEVWLDGDWYLVDPTRLAPINGLIRIAAGRDATDVAFMSIFGTAEMKSQSVSVTRLGGTVDLAAA
jgi:transglutaminase-like putative cysteine protease